MFVRQQVWNLLGMHPSMSCFLLAFVSWVWIGTVKFVGRHRPAWFSLASLGEWKTWHVFLLFWHQQLALNSKESVLPSPCDVKCCMKSRNAVFVAWGLQMGFAWPPPRTGPGATMRPLASLGSIACVATKTLRRRAEWVLRGNVFVTLADRIKHSWSFLLMLQDKGYRVWSWIVEVSRFLDIFRVAWGLQLGLA